MAEKKAEIKIGYDGKEATKGLSSLKTNVSKTAATIKKDVAIASAAFVALSAAIYKTVTVSAEQEKSELLLANSFKLNNEEVTKNLKISKEWAAQLQKNSIVGDEVSLSLLLMSKQMGATTKQGQDIVSSAADLSAALGISLDMAVRGLSTTLSGQLGIFGRYVPAIRDLTVEQLKHGDAITLIQNKYAGFAQELAGTSLGQIEQAKNAFGDLIEVIGKQFAPEFIKFANVIKTVSVSLGKNSDFINALQDFKTVLKNTFQFIIDNKAILAALGTSFLVLGTSVGRSATSILLLAQGFNIAKKAFVDFEKTKKGVLGFEENTRLTVILENQAKQLQELSVKEEEVAKQFTNIKNKVEQIKFDQLKPAFLQTFKQSDLKDYEARLDITKNKLSDVRNEQAKTESAFKQTNEQIKQNSADIKVFANVFEEDITKAKETVNSLINGFKNLNNLDLGSVVDNSEGLSKNTEKQNTNLGIENDLLMKNILLYQERDELGGGGVTPTNELADQTPQNNMFDNLEREKELLQEHSDFKIELMNQENAINATIQEGRIEAFDGWIEHQKQAEQDMLNFKFGVFQSAGSAFAKMLTGNSKDLKKYFLFFVADTIRSYANMKAQQELATASNATNIATQATGWSAFYSALAVGMSAYNPTGAAQLTTSAGLLTGAAGVNTAVATSSLAKAAAWSIGGQVAAAGIESLAGSTSSGDTSLATDGITTTAEDTPLTTSTQSGSNITLVFRDNIFGDDKEAFYEFTRDKIVPNLQEQADLSLGGLQLG